MQEDERVFLGSLEVSKHSIEVKSLGRWFVVAVMLPVESAKLGKVLMEWPGWLWDEEVDILMRIPVFEESKSNSE